MALASRGREAGSLACTSSGVVMSEGNGGTKDVGLANHGVGVPLVETGTQKYYRWYRWGNMETWF